MYSYYCILLVLCITSYSLSASSTFDGTCVNPTTLSFIENSLTNISDQLKDGVTENLNSIFQLSWLKEVIGSCKENTGSNSSNEEGLALLKRIELILNTSTAATDARLNAIEPQLVSLQSQVSSLSSDLKKIYQLLEEHVNITGNCEEETSPTSCDAILNKWPNSPSGYYNLTDVNGHTRHVYCHMETLCGKGGGWRRIASLNMTDPNEKCPTQFRTYSQDGVCACGRPVTNSGSCVGITFPSRNIKYSQLCGKVSGYQVGFTDGAYRHQTGGTINSPYTDGVSLTYGSLRKHIWTFMSGATGSGLHNHCPCGTTGTKFIPSFIDSNYYCESGYEGPDTPVLAFQYFSDPLWDGKGCGSSETNCCQRTLIPWFYRSFGNSTTDYIEMRICCDEGTSDEDVSVEKYEIYVK